MSGSGLDPDAPFGYMTINGALVPMTVDVKNQLPGTGTAVVIPQSVSNSDMRIVLQNRFLPNGTSYYTATQGFLSSNLAATVSLPDEDETKRAALEGWTRWDMGNFFLRSDPIIAVLAGAFGLSEADVDNLFIEAGAL